MGPGVTGLAPGDLVVPTVRRPGGSLYDRISHYDMTTDDVYFERGINLRHGFLTEHFVDEPEYIVKIPRGLSKVGVLLVPASVIDKGIAQAFEIQRRLRVWRSIRLEKPSPGDAVLDGLPVVDELGQYAHGSWPGKARSVEDLRAAWRDEGGRSPGGTARNTDCRTAAGSPSAARGRPKPGSRPLRE